MHCITVPRAYDKLRQYRHRAKLVRRAEYRDLYRTFFGDLFWLSKDPNAWVDKCIRERSVFESDATRFVKKFVRKGDIVLDIGANIGYFSVLMSNLVGTGHVFCFEPTAAYFKVLQENIEINRCSNITLLEYGLSDKNQTLEMCIDESSATLHVEPGKDILSTEQVRLTRLDDVVDVLNINKLDFIKIDVDGHESAFLQGALKTLARFKPVVLLEVSHMNYLQCGVFVWDFYDYLCGLGFHVYSESTLQEYASQTEFLKECGNFAYSANIILSFESLP